MTRPRGPDGQFIEVPDVARRRSEGRVSSGRSGTIVGLA